MLAAIAVASSSPAALAFDPFEIQVYDGTADPVAVPGLELHLNDWATGHREGLSPERPLHGQFHTTLEPSFGVTRFWELGAYLQTAARSDDGAFDWAGVKLRSKFVTPPGWDRRWRLGANFEVSYLPPAYDADRWGLEVRPILAWQNERWLVAVNPIVDASLAGPGAAAGPSFEPAAKVARALGPLAVGAEYYANFGPIGSPLPWKAQEHYLFEVIDWIGLDRVELDVGLGEGFTPASAGIVLKAIVGYTFDENVPPPLQAASNPRRRIP